MLKDLHTEDGQRAMAVGQKWERRVWEVFKSLDSEARWISGAEGDYLAGHDFIFKGKRVEVKSNEGVGSNGILYSTCCLELETRGANTIGWRCGKADVVLLINRAQRRGYFYDAKKLSQWAKHRAFFWKHDAKCIKIDWANEAAGFFAEVEL